MIWRVHVVSLTGYSRLASVSVSSRMCVFSVRPRASDRVVCLQYAAQSREESAQLTLTRPFACRARREWSRRLLLTVARTFAPSPSSWRRVIYINPLRRGQSSLVVGRARTYRPTTPSIAGCSAPRCVFCLVGRFGNDQSRRLRR